MSNSPIIAQKSNIVVRGNGFVTEIRIDGSERITQRGNAEPLRSPIRREAISAYARSLVERAFGREEGANLYFSAVNGGSYTTSNGEMIAESNAPSPFAEEEVNR
jgi:hypothetical protein